MRRVRWTDRQGYNRVSLIGNDEDESDAQFGVRIDPPDVVNEIDWMGAAKEIHNRLVDAGLFNWQDVQRQQNALGGIVRSVVVRRLTDLYRMHDKQEIFTESEGGA